jgi:hypothetical protein
MGRPYITTERPDEVLFFTKRPDSKTLSARKGDIIDVLEFLDKKNKDFSWLVEVLKDV